MDGENALDAFAIADAAHGERFVQPVAAAAEDDAGENLDAFLIAFNDLGVDLNTVADFKFHGLFAILFRFDFV